MGREFPFTRTREPVAKPAPATFTWDALLPAGRVDGEMEDTPGLTVNVSAAEVAPPGFVTITYGFPAMAIELAEISAISCVEFTKLVGTLIRLKLTSEPCTKPAPFTVRANAGPPAVALDGEILLTPRRAMGATIEKTIVLEVPPSESPVDGLVTDTVAVP